MRSAVLLALLFTESLLAATGAPISEPALVGRPDIIHFEDWEQEDWWKASGWNGPKPRAEGGWEHPGVTTNLGRVLGATVGAPTPGYVLTINTERGSHVGSVNPRVSLDAYNLDEAYVRYYFMLNSNMVYFDPDPSSPEYKDGGKLPGLARRGPGDTIKCCMAQDYSLPEDGAVGWSARFYHWGNRDYPNRRYLSNYVYHLDDTSDPGSQWPLNGYFAEGVWYCMEQRVKMNTPNQNDGIFENWIDGEKKHSTTTLRFRSVQANNIGELWFGVYVGGANVASYSGPYVYFDNLVIAKERIGCLSPTQPTPIPPPQTFRAIVE